MSGLLLLLDYKDLYTRAALLEEQTGKILDFFIPPKTDFLLDSLLVGRVTKVFSNYCFVEVTDTKLGLLKFEKGFDKPTQGDVLALQVSREAMPDTGEKDGVKGIQLTRKIALSTQAMVYHPYKKGLFFSDTVKDQTTATDRQGYHHLFESPCLTLREAALHQDPFQLLEQESHLIHRYDLLLDRLQSKKIGLVEKGPTFMERLQKDHPDTLKIVTNDLKAAAQFKCSYKRDNFFKDYDLEETWQTLFDKRLVLKCGGSCVIEETSCALTIDINPSARGQDRVANAQAFCLIARHLKWRRLSGNGIIDVAGLEHFSLSDKQHLEDILKKETQDDWVKTSVLGWTKLGFLEFQRPKRFSPLRFHVPA